MTSVSRNMVPSDKIIILQIGWVGRNSSVAIAKFWTVRGSNPGGSDIFRTLPDQPLGPFGLLYNRYRDFPRGKAAEA